MALESGTFIEDLVITNPPGTDSKSQGDDHLQLIKKVLRNTIKRATKAFYLPATVAKTANYSVLSSDDNMTVVCDTSGGSFTLTLPSLAVGDAGWNLFVVKSNAGANPVFLAPTSGTINGFSTIRRAIRYATTRVSWTGSVWIATRPDGRPIGSVTSFYGSALPDGYLWCDGNTFVAGNFVELNSVMGTNATPDLRGRGEYGRDNMGIGAANRLTAAGSGVDGATLKATGGAENKAISISNMPTHDHTFATGGASADHTHSGNTNTDGSHDHTAFVGDDPHSHTIPSSIASAVNPGTGSTAVTGTTGSGQSTGTTPSKIRSTAGTAAGADGKTSQTGSTHSHAFTTSGVSANHTHSGTTDTRGSGTTFGVMNPAIVCNKIMLAE